VSNSSKGDLEGITLNVYLYIVKKRKKVGPREVMKGIGLSSPSVAYRHLQKLEDLGLLKKNRYGEYLVKKKAKVRDHIWIRQRLLPKMLVYFIIFLGILITEFVVFAIHFNVENYTFKVFFVLLIIVTGFAMGVFAVEALLHRRRVNRNIQG
jgi:polyferredoxin